ncbi:MAG: DUF2029 domain-containing protein [Prevotellaceae bacterium]|jgi:hypothetical protein|nr:DUF2029 domain-containing protein [Prevotellaceae bacterium]
MKIQIRLQKIIAQKKYVVLTYVAFALIASILSLAGRKRTFDQSGIQHTKYNNYVIFKSSFYHLKEGKDLYVLYPQEHWDLYKYTPTFSALFGALAALPDWVGLNVWNLLNALLFVLAIYYLPFFNDYKKGLILAVCLIELMTSMQNSQSNALMAGLIILAVGLLEKDKYLWATLCVVFSIYIKLFGIVGLALFLLYPKKLKLTLYSLAWAVVLFAVPLIFVSWQQYAGLMQSYLSLLSHDHAASYGYSVMGWLNSWFGYADSKNMVVLAGAIIFMLPFCKVKNYTSHTFRLLMLASVLVWVVIFNHKAESPTFVIAIAGVALWFTHGEKNIVNITLFALAFIFASLSPTDIFPRFVREEFVKPYCLKAVPCIFIWGKIMYDLLTSKPSMASKPLHIENEKE